MTVYYCDANWESMLTCIYEAWASRKGHANVTLRVGPVEQYDLFREYVYVTGDSRKAESVKDAIIRKISYSFYRELSYVGMSHEEDALDTIYRMVVLGFAYGPGVGDMYQSEAVQRFRKLYRAITTEADRFREFMRFHEASRGVYVAHFEPRGRILPVLAECFTDRMPSEMFIIVDDVHREALVHPMDEPCYIRMLTDDEFERILMTEEENDDYTDLWRVFFETIAIRERANAKCQQNHMPYWVRKHMVEMSAH